MELVRRTGWDARNPNGNYSSMPSTPDGVKVHYTGSRENPVMLTDHGLCVRRVRSVQNGHMDGNQWIDIGYSFVVCPHGTVFEGRGIGHVPAANGPGLNSAHYAVLALVGNAGLTEPTAAMVSGLREAIAYIRRWGRAGNEIRGHRDGYSTDCPGSALYRLVTSGALEPNQETSEDDVPNYLSLALNEDQAQQLPPDVWTTLTFDVEHADPEDQHAKGRYPSFLSGKARFCLTVDITLEGLIPGVEGQLRLYEVDQAGKVVKRYGIDEWAASAGKTFVHHVAVGTVDEGHRLRAEVVQFGDSAARVTQCAVKALYWR